MCSVFGALVHLRNRAQVEEANRILTVLYRRSIERGRDGRGWYMKTTDYNDDLSFKQHRSTKRHNDRDSEDIPQFDGSVEFGSLVGNMRAEPTTEFVNEKHDYDQQPYSSGRWHVVHNGTIANDKELRAPVPAWSRCETRIDSAAIPEVLAMVDRDFGDGDATDFGKFKLGINQLKGSFAILATVGADHIYVACNYRPVWYIETEYGVFFGSTRRVFPEQFTPCMIEPYTVHEFRMTEQGPKNRMLRSNMRDNSYGAKALVVCSGGLDSVVSAAWAKENGYRIELIHFQYGSRAEGPEVQAVQKVAEALGCKVTLFPLPVYKKGDSPLLDPDSVVAGGEAGAEFAHEWVPARNLLLLSVATAYAEANGFETLVLGNNLEEAGAYPDNEPEFIDRFNDLLPFAVGDGKKLKVIMPVGNMMKHEIVQLGLEVKAPMHLTWSCYRAGTVHCGTCGPCFMRRTAFQINNTPEVIDYAV